MMLALAANGFFGNCDIYAADYIYCYSATSTPKEVTPTDADNDGYYVCVGSYACENTIVSSNYTVPGTCDTKIDYDDNDISVYPDAPELCDGKDNDRNANTADGAGESWYLQETTCGVGACSATGRWECQAGKKTDTCSPGAGSYEICNGVDDDCDGTPDDGLDCRFLYVDDDCTEGSQDGSETNPYCSIQNAINSAAALPGTQILVKPGQYDGFVVYKSALTIKAYDESNKPVIKANGKLALVDPDNSGGGVYTSVAILASYTTIDGISIQGGGASTTSNPEVGILISGGAIKTNYPAGGAPPTSYYASAQVKYVTIKNCVIEGFRPRSNGNKDRGYGIFIIGSNRSDDPDGQDRNTQDILIGGKDNGNIFSGNNRAVGVLADVPRLVVSYNNLSNNGNISGLTTGHALGHYFPGGLELDARKNWWGAANGPSSAASSGGYVYDSRLPSLAANGGGSKIYSFNSTPGAEKIWFFPYAADAGFTTFPPSGSDADGDDIDDAFDNCPAIANADQADADNDGYGDVCDSCPNDPANDADGDGICGNEDNCPNKANADQVDADGDGIGDVCDNCPEAPNPEQTNYDGDSAGDACDACPDDSTKVTGCDPLPDSDGDGVPDTVDECPSDKNKAEPGACGCGIADDDLDGDGAPDCFEECDDDPLKTVPGACGCGTPDTDNDGDGTPNCNDNCPLDPAKTQPGDCGCGTPDTDNNGNGTSDCLENNVCVGFNDSTLCAVGNVTTIQEGIDLVSAFGTVYVAVGEYDGFKIDKPNITVQAYEGAEVKINGTGVSVTNGIERTAAVYVTGDNATLRGLTIDNDNKAYTSGVIVDNASGVKINFNNINVAVQSTALCVTDTTKDPDSNASYGLMVIGSVNVNAKNNWWGSNAGPALTSADCFAYEPYLTARYGGTVKETGAGTIPNPIPGIASITVTGTGSVVLASYENEPKVGSGFAAGAIYFDITDVTGVSELKLTICGVDDIKYYDENTATWKSCSPITIDGSGCLVLTLNDTSTPKLSDLTGTIFAAGKNPSSGGGSTSTTTTVPPSGGGGGGGTTVPVLQTTGYVKFYFPEGDTSTIQTQSFSITNAGGGVLQWSVGDPVYGEGSGSGWITNITPRSGSGNGIVAVTVNRTLLPNEPGIYQAAIPITSNGGNDSVAIRVGIVIEPPPPAPALVVTPGSVAFDPTVTEQEITVENTGDTAGTWDIAVRYNGNVQGWLTVNPQTIQLDPQESESVALLVDRTGIAEGTYTAVVEFSAGGEVGAIVNVTMQVGGAAGNPVLTVDKPFYFVRRTQNSVQITIRNTGSGTLTWSTGDIQYSGATGWLSVEPQSGSLGAGEQTTITATVDRNAVPRLRFYRAVVPIVSNAGAKNVTILMWNPFFRW